MFKRHEGLIPAVHSPFDASGDLNLAAVEAQAQVLGESRALAAFVCGSTGESHSLTIDERMKLARRWVDVAGKSMDVIVHVGHNAQREAMALAAHAREIGAAAVSAIAPCYFRPATVDDLIEFLAPVARAAGPLPFYFYDIPSMTNVRLPMDQFLQRAEATIANLAGLKYTSDDLMTLQSCLAMRDRFEILYGTDEVLLAVLALGVRGGIGSTYNYAAPVYHRVIAHFQRGDLAAAQVEQRKSVELVKVLLRFGVLRAGKAIMSMLGAECGPVRPPISALNRQQLGELYAALAGMDIFARQLRHP